MSKKKIVKIKEVKKEKKIKLPKDNSTKRIKIKIIGIGGGGGNIIKELSKKLDFSSNKIDFTAVNTDFQALEALPSALKKIAFGENETRGLGTGRDISLGKQIAENEEKKIKNIFSDGKDLYILVSSLGGGTGTGTIPVFSKIAKEMNLPTLGIFTLPFNFEGKDKMKESQKAIDEARADLNAVLVIPNERIFKFAEENIPFNDALNIINEQLARSLQGLLNTVYSSGLINIDWADIRTTIEGENQRAYLNTVEAKLTDDLNQFTNQLLNNELVRYDFSKSNNVLFNIEGGKNLSMQQLALISEKIHELAPEARIIFGLTQSSKLKNEIKATVLATGVMKKEEKKVKVKEEKKEEKKVVKTKKVKKETPKKKKTIKEVEEDLKDLEDLGVEINRRNAVEVKRAEEEARKKDLDEDDIFEVPAFLRKKK
ncbi:MAG: cell division protein FtsZ [Candidatus Pacebacteria bacterium]|nr:cell division protein FtsZ [Candidatus Paceibacterota bacterium]MDD3919110.1 cell division protein FtsZ [Candidatus Paceibacterota bacterium]